MKPYEHHAEFIKQYMRYQLRGYTLLELSKEIGVAPSTISGRVNVYRRNGLKLPPLVKGLAVPSGTRLERFIPELQRIVDHEIAIHKR